MANDPLFSTGDPVLWATVVCALFALTAYLRSSYTGNFSFVDRVWSITPPIYAWIFAGFTFAKAGFDPRSLVGALLVTAWGARLTWNFARKGGYKPGEEDYRWPTLRKIITNKVLWSLFNLFFISIYQNFLVFLTTLPLWAAYLGATATPQPAPQWTPTDTIGTIAFVVLLAGETLADNQQWAFQTEKYAQLNAGKKLSELAAPYRYGFLNRGLFAVSRHPNFFCEFMQWWALYLLSVGCASATPLAFGEGVKGWLNWTIVGAVLLTLLFVGSTRFTEFITERKYPLYAVYKKRVSALVPWIPGSQDLESGPDAEAVLAAIQAAAAAKDSGKAA
ncbi:hypothetical protein HK105_208361 [Polyrhizophydium stewartii]|uniref:Steroid 5-alpha reductase C-terminal domain-containing protein n=1 Tax=Polyrhizophydium stewartii TaxID=2732419 RepID=A0ABR4MXY2_9FUNG